MSLVLLTLRTHVHAQKEDWKGRPWGYVQEEAVVDSINFALAGSSRIILFSL